MAAQRSGETKLISLPQELRSVIMEKIAEDSPMDFANTIRSGKAMAEAVDKDVYHKLNLSPFVKKPLVSAAYPKVMDKCLASGNVEAHYVKGILGYFKENRSDEGMQHLKISAKGGHEESIYLYGILLLCNDQISEGNFYLGQLKWVDNTDAAQSCWKRIKRSLHGIRVERKAIYYSSLAKLQPEEECHIYDMENTCDKCFGFKQVVKFLNMM